MNDLSKARKLIKECKDNQNPDLDLGNCGITDLNEIPELLECTHIEFLELSHNQISDINILAKLKKLTHLGISNNPIMDYGFSENMPLLEYLDLSNNHIDVMWLITTGFFKNLTKLESLCLSKNQIPDFSVIKLGVKADLNENIRCLEKSIELESLSILIEEDLDF